MDQILVATRDRIEASGVNRNCWQAIPRCGRK
jgi:hypothetical protein